MANDPAFLFYPGDYLRDTQTLSEKSQVAYDRIMCEHMRNICISHKQLNFFTKRLTDEEKEELMFVLTEVEGGYSITWVAESIVKRRNYSESRRKNRVSKKKKKEDNTSSSYVNHMENEIENEDENRIRTENTIELEVQPTFEEFWDLYDKKTGKEECRRLWKALGQKDREAIMDYLPGYVRSTPDPTYRKNPKTFLNKKNRHWEDEIVISGNTGNRPDILREAAILMGQ